MGVKYGERLGARPGGGMMRGPSSASRQTFDTEPYPQRRSPALQGQQAPLPAPPSPDFRALMRARVRATAAPVGKVPVHAPTAAPGGGLTRSNVSGIPRKPALPFPAEVPDFRTLGRVGVTQGQLFAYPGKGAMAQAQASQEKYEEEYKPPERSTPLFQDVNKLQTRTTPEFADVAWGKTKVDFPEYHRGGRETASPEPAYLTGKAEIPMQEEIEKGLQDLQTNIAEREAAVNAAYDQATFEALQRAQRRAAARGLGATGVAEAGLQEIEAQMAAQRAQAIADIHKEAFDQRRAALEDTINYAMQTGNLRLEAEAKAEAARNDALEIAMKRSGQEFDQVMAISQDFDNALSQWASLMFETGKLSLAREREVMAKVAELKQAAYEAYAAGTLDVRGLQLRLAEILQMAQQWIVDVNKPGT